MSAPSRNQTNPEKVVLRNLIEKWAQAVRNEDLQGIRAHHDPDILMFDVPPPFQSCGLGAYMATWQTFFPSQSRPIDFFFDEVAITAGDQVAFATAIGRCAYIDRANGDAKTGLKFRLTMCFRKRDDQWLIVHEHHSVPAID